MPESVFTVGNGVSSVDAWFSAALDIEEVLSRSCDDQLHVLVDVVKWWTGPFLTVLLVGRSCHSCFGGCTSRST